MIIVPVLIQSVLVRLPRLRFYILRNHLLEQVHDNVGEWLHLMVILAVFGYDLWNRKN